jgi:hypothetical protein
VGRYLVILLLLVATPSFGANYYINCEAGSDGDGSWASPWNVYSTRLNPASSALSDGDGVYFAEGTTCTLNGGTRDEIELDVANVTLGCADGNGDHSCDITIATGSGMPKFDGGSRSYPTPTNDHAFIRIHASGVTVQDIWVADMSHGGIQANGTNPEDGDSATIQRVRASGMYRQAIYGTNSDNSTITNNYVTDNLHIRATTCGAIGGAAVTCDWGCGGTTISYNTVYDNYGEGIGNYMNRNTADPNYISYNIVHNSRSGNIHATDSETVIRWNLVGIYDTGGDLKEAYFDNSNGDTYPNCYKESNSGGITVQGTNENSASFDNKYWIYGNVVHGFKNTPGIAASLGTTACSDGDTLWAVIYNNTVVDSDPNYRTNKACNDAKDITYKNNISVFYDESANHCEENDTGGGGDVIWDRNLWDSDPVDNDCEGANDPTYADAVLTTQTGYAWPGARTTIGWAGFVLDPSSPAVDSSAAENLGSPYNTDYYGVTRGGAGTWDLGALESTGTLFAPGVTVD